MRLRLPYRLVGSFKGMLFVLACAIIAAVIIYTDRMVSDLRESSRRYLTLKVERFKNLLLHGDDAALESYLSEMAAKDFPVIITDSSGTPTSSSGIPGLDDLRSKEAQKRARQHIREWVRKGNQPVPFELPEYGLKQYYYYGDSRQIRQLQMMPWIEVAVVGGLILIGYLGFSSIRRSEERFVWVGMARETAHQLGTPLTSLYGWMELLEDRPNDSKVREEIGRDLKQLSTVADRFSRIGSKVQLELIPLRPIVEEAVEYIKRRLPQISGREVTIEVDVPGDLNLELNHTLFKWALENLLKNGVEALRGKAGRVMVKAYTSGQRTCIDIIDNGCGIPRRQWRNVFRPGYSTKERGWGLGMSLTRRIVEDAHGGRIFIVDSNPDRGTVIRIAMKWSGRADL